MFERVTHPLALDGWTPTDGVRLGVGGTQLREVGRAAHVGGCVPRSASHDERRLLGRLGVVVAATRLLILLEHHAIVDVLNLVSREKINESLW